MADIILEGERVGDGDLANCIRFIEAQRQREDSMGGPARPEGARRELRCADARFVAGSPPCCRWRLDRARSRPRDRRAAPRRADAPGGLRAERPRAAQPRRSRPARQGGPAGVTVEMPQGLELTFWAPEHAGRRSGGDRRRPDGTVYVDQHVAQQHAARHPRPQDWMATVHTLRTVADLRAFYQQGDGAGEQREERLDSGPQPGRLARHPRPHEMKERVYRLRDTDGDGLADAVADRLRGLQRGSRLGRRRRRAGPGAAT